MKQDNSKEDAMKYRKSLIVLLTIVLLISAAVTPTAAQSSDWEKDPNIVYRTVSLHIFALSPDREKYPDILSSASTETEHYKITMTTYRGGRNMEINITEKLSNDNWIVEYQPYINFRGICVCFEDKNGDIIVVFAAGKNADIALLIDVDERVIANDDIVTRIYYNKNTGELWTSGGRDFQNLHTKEIINIPDNVGHGLLGLFCVSNEGEISFSISTNIYDEENVTSKYYVMSKNENGTYEAKLIKSPKTDIEQYTELNEDTAKKMYSEAREILIDIVTGDIKYDCSDSISFGSDSVYYRVTDERFSDYASLYLSLKTYFTNRCVNAILEKAPPIFEHEGNAYIAAVGTGSNIHIGNITYLGFSASENGSEIYVSTEILDDEFIPVDTVVNTFRLKHEDGYLKFDSFYLDNYDFKVEFSDYHETAPKTGTPTVPLTITAAAAFAVLIRKKQNFF